jgi:hypothetical protein
VFGIVRRKSHGLMARSEFNQGVEHFKAAATHAARGTGAAVGPRIESARDRVQPAAGKVRNAATGSWGSAVAALAPLAAAATEGARQAGKKPAKASEATKKNMKQLDKKAGKVLAKKADKALGKNKKQSGGRSKLFGLGIAGLAVGAVAAAMMRKRQQEQWDEYDPSQPIGAVGSESMPASMSPEPTTSISSVTNEVDQTSSSLHSPTVAKMAGGDSPAS